jgi:drug/metabolite transporter (DMT)-like permease
VLALEDKIGLWDWTLLRNLLILILALIGLASKKINPFKAVPRAKWGVLFGRVVTSLLLNMFMNVSLELIPYSLLVVLYQTNPFMTSILSYCVNGEKINIIEALGMVLSFTAVGFIAYSAEQSSEVEEEVEEENGKSATEYLLGIGFILAAAACVSGSAVLNRSLKTINFNVVMVYQGIFGILVASSYEIGRIIISGSDESVLRLASLLDASDGGLLALGLFMDAGSIFCLTIAYQKSEAGFVSLVGFVRIVYALFVDLFIFEESIGFIEIAGSGVICLVTIVVAIDKIIK